jgi:hypothetical protein
MLLPLRNNLEAAVPAVPQLPIQEIGGGAMVGNRLRYPLERGVALTRGEYEERAVELRAAGTLRLVGRAEMTAMSVPVLRVAGRLVLSGSIVCTFDVRLARLRRDDRELEELLIVDAA